MTRSYSDDISGWIELARKEIHRKYGHVTTLGNTLLKFGQCDVVDNDAEYDIASYITSSFTNEVMTTGGNPIDSLSSDDVSDTDVPIYIEGATRSGDDLTFSSQTVNTDATNGQTRVPLTTPLSDVTRVRGVSNGNIWIYENTALSGGKPSDLTKIHNQLVAGDRSSLKAGAIVDKDQYFLLMSDYCIPGKLGGTNAITARLRIARLGDPVTGDEFVDQQPWSVALGSPPDGPRTIPFRIVRPNSRIQLTGSGSGNADVITYGGFSGVYLTIDREKNVLMSTRSREFV